MTCRIDDKRKIFLTRGDTARMYVSILYKDSGEKYTPREDDIVRFSVKRYLSDKTPVIVKDIPLDTLLLELLPDDTSPLMFGEYHYDIQLIHADGDTDTFIPDSILRIGPEVN